MNRHIYNNVNRVIGVAALLLAMTACGNKAEDKAEKQPQQPPKVVMDVPSGTKAPATEPVDTLPGQTHVTVTCRCFAATNPNELDELPYSMSTARKDTSLLRRINDGEVYVVSPGEKGYILAKDNNRLQIRFPDKIAWVMESNTK